MENHFLPFAPVDFRRKLEPVPSAQVLSYTAIVGVSTLIRFGSSANSLVQFRSFWFHFGLGSILANSGSMCIYIYIYICIQLYAYIIIIIIIIMCFMYYYCYVYIYIYTHI